MRKLLFVLALSLIFTFCIQKVTFAGETDILVDKLVEKGILTPGEAQKILTETKEEIRKEEIREEVAKGEPEMLPKWVQNMEMKGDIRLRYQNEDIHEVEGSQSRQRGRVRYRLGIETKVTDTIKAGAGLATGGTDPRSTNQTLEHGFSTKSIMLDYAYVKYAANPLLTLYGGKFKRSEVIWEPSDLLWDGDINPEGVAAVFKTEMDSTDLFLNAGFYTLEHFRENRDVEAGQSLFVLQPGASWQLNEKKSYLKGTVTYYGFNRVKNNHFHDDAESGGSNTYKGDDYRYDYSAWTPSVEIGVTEPFGGGLPFFAFFAEYIQNPDPGKENEGYLYGIKFGDKSVKDRRQWQAKMLYRQLERDAWLDIFSYP